MKRLLTLLTLTAVLALPARAQITDGANLTVDYQGYTYATNIALPFYQFSVEGYDGMYWDFLCIDATSWAQTNAYTALFSEVEGGNLAGTKENSLQTYRITAYLYEEAQLAFAAGDKTALDAIQRAAWYATNGAGPYLGSAFYGADNSYYQAAYDAVVNNQYSAEGFYVVTHATDASKQEFLMRVPVPEPGTILLVLSGMVGIALTARRRRFLTDAV